jgi:hypothetical protein
MRSVVSIMVLGTLLAGCAPDSGNAQQALTPTHAVAMTDSARATLASWREAINALDADRVAAHYLADSTFRWLEDGVVRYRHPLEVANAIRELAGTIQRTELLLDGTVLTPLAPGVVAVTTGFAQKVEDREGRIGGFAGAISAVLVHREAGWVFQLGHTSSGGAPSTGGPDPR